MLLITKTAPVSRWVLTIVVLMTDQLRCPLLLNFWCLYYHAICLNELILYPIFFSYLCMIFALGWTFKAKLDFKLILIKSNHLFVLILFWTVNVLLDVLSEEHFFIENSKLQLKYHEILYIHFTNNQKFTSLISNII